MDLAKKKCVPCEGGFPALKRSKALELLKQVSRDWRMEEKQGVPVIRRTIKFKDFVEAMKFVNEIADIAESEGHHPNILIEYNKVTLEFYTHAINGLRENDFIMAAKIDDALNKFK